MSPLRGITLRRRRKALQAGFLYFIPKVAVTLGGEAAVGKLKYGLAVNAHFFYVGQVGYVAFEEHLVFIKGLYYFVVQAFAVINHIEEALYFTRVKAVLFKIINHCFVGADR